jgi:hypothetical protein
MNVFRLLFCAVATATIASACSSASSGTAPAGPSGRGVTYTSAFSAQLEGSQVTIHVLPPRNSPVFAANGAPKQAAPVAASPTPTPTPNPLVYQNGPIQAHPIVYTVWYGNGWNSPSGDPGGEKPFLKNFYKAVGNSKWLNDVRQYGEADGATPDNEATLQSGSWVDATSPLTTSPDYFDMYAEALAAAAHFGDYSINANYVILTPKGITPVGFESAYCGYHSAAYVATQDKWVSYTVLPYLADSNAIIPCAGNYFGHSTDAPSIVAGHELAEAITDPLPLGNLNSGYWGWVDAVTPNANNAPNPRWEIGDKCAWQNLEINATIGDGMTYPSQPLFNNATLQCRQEPNKQY